MNTWPHIQDLQISSTKRWKRSKFIDVYTEDTILLYDFGAKVENFFW